MQLHASSALLTEKQLILTAAYVSKKRVWKKSEKKLLIRGRNRTTRSWVSKSVAYSLYRP